MTTKDDSTTLFLFQMEDGLLGKSVSEVDAVFHPDDVFSFSCFFVVAVLFIQ